MATSKAIISLGEGVREVYFPLAPVPGARPRVSKWGTYYPKKYATWRKEAARMLDEVGAICEPWLCPVYVFASYGAPRPTKPANPFPVPDIDNFEKAAYDAIVKCGYLLGDDKQIVVTLHGKRYVKPGEQPYTYIAMFDSWDAMVDVAFLQDTEPKSEEDVYDLPEIFRTPLHLLEEE